MPSANRRPNSHHLLQELLSPLEKGKTHHPRQIPHCASATCRGARPPPAWHAASERARKDHWQTDRAQCADQWQEHWRRRRCRQIRLRGQAGRDDQKPGWQAHHGSITCQRLSLVHARGEQGRQKMTPKGPHSPRIALFVHWWEKTWFHSLV